MYHLLISLFFQWIRFGFRFQRNEILGRGLQSAVVIYVRFSNPRNNNKNRCMSLRIIFHMFCNPSDTRQINNAFENNTC